MIQYVNRVMLFYDKPRGTQRTTAEDRHANPLTEEWEEGRGPEVSAGDSQGLSPGSR